MIYASLDLGWHQEYATSRSKYCRQSAAMSISAFGMAYHRLPFALTRMISQVEG